MSLTEEKQRIREEVWNRLWKEGISKDPFGRIPDFIGQEKAAELLKEMEIYKKAKKIFVPPDRAQYEVRVNVVLDDKSLVMATPKLRDGFYKVDYTCVPERFLKLAVLSRYITKYGKKLHTSYEDIGRVDLMVTGAVAVSRYGERIGKSSGYFDLEYAILWEIGSVGPTTPIVATVHDIQIFSKLPTETHDVPVDYIITPKDIIKIEPFYKKPKGINWNYVDDEILRKIPPLKELRH
ncbi:MAG: 5-formyltetrahydrofolate cyclo-ligase [Candidatus Aenigmarchaeota archaeon]|nr:5-formyltetrahydrofolate cyclo-ligase [Candidatus Aenigmarchaeota archaeon]